MSTDSKSTTSKSTSAACGIRVFASSLASTRDSVAAARAELGDQRFQHIIAFFSIEHEAELLVSALQSAFPEIPVSGCSTAGEVGPLGMMQGGLVLIAFPETGFRVLSEVISVADEPGVKRATDIARRLKVQISDGHNSSMMGNTFALMLVDGLSNKEEALTAAVHWGLGDIELIGGSAGDGLAFRRTALVHNGNIVQASALLFVIESAFPFRIFKTQNFEPTPIKLVVTAADTENRIVYELNAEPAAREYAAAIGLLPAELGPFSFASYPLVVKVGGDYYCRSIRNMNPDGSLSFFCAIDEGLVRAIPSRGAGETLVRIHQVNTRRIIHARVPVEEGRAAVAGDYAIAGVAGTGARIRLDFLDPGGAVTGKLLPTGKVREQMAIAGHAAPFEVSIVDAAVPIVYVAAAGVGLTGAETPDAIEAKPGVMALLDQIRRAAGVRIGQGATPDAVGLQLPRVAVVAPPIRFTSLDGRSHAPDDYDIATRMISMERAHRAIPGTGGLNLGVAARIEGSIPHALARASKAAAEIRVGNPSGLVSVGAEVTRAGGVWTAGSAVLFRTARRLMQGEVAVRAGVFESTDGAG